MQRPLVLLVAARRAERELRLAVAPDQCRRQRRARTLARRQRVRQPLLEPEHLRARAEAEAELGHRPVRPAASRRSGSRRPCCPKRSTTSRWQVSPLVAGVASARRARRPRPRPSLRRRSARRGSRARRRTRPEFRRRLVADQRPPLRGVLAREQHVQRDVGESGSPYQASRSAKASFALSVTVCTYVGRRLAQLGEVEAVQQRAAAAARPAPDSRPGLEHRHAVVVDGERLSYVGDQSRRSSPVSSPLCRSPGAVHERACCEAASIASATKPRYQASCAASIWPRGRRLRLASSTRRR